MADARRNMRNAKEAIEWNLGKLREMTSNKLPERLRAMMLAQSEAFTATVQGKTSTCARMPRKPSTSSLKRKCAWSSPA